MILDLIKVQALGLPILNDLLLKVARALRFEKFVTESHKRCGLLICEYVRACFKKCAVNQQIKS